MHNDFNEAQEAVKNAERMFNYATTQTDIDTAINLLSLSLDKLDFVVMCNKKEFDIVTRMDATYIASIKPINENPTLWESIKESLARRCKNVKFTSKA